MRSEQANECERELTSLLLLSSIRKWWLIVLIGFISNWIAGILVGSWIGFIRWCKCNINTLLETLICKVCTASLHFFKHPQFYLLLTELLATGHLIYKIQEKIWRNENVITHVPINRKRKKMVAPTFVVPYPCGGVSDLDHSPLRYFNPIKHKNAHKPIENGIQKMYVNTTLSANDKRIKRFTWES